MKIRDLEGGDQLVTKADLAAAVRELKTGSRELRVELLERFSGLGQRMARLEERMNRLERVIWLPVAASVAQIVVALLHR